MRYLLSLLLLVTFRLEARANTLFPSSPAIEQRAQFWQRIFTEFSSQEAVVHDLNDTRLILGTIPVEARASRKTSRNSRQLNPLAGYEAAVRSFADKGVRAQHDSALAARIWQVYSQDLAARERLLNGQVELRTQGGLSDTFAQAYKTSKLYLPKMEKIFQAHGIPPELTRIAFVESMFNVKARSKVGASGIWQLMPQTARQYLRVDRRVDERNAPLKASRAAAKILKANYRELKSWPLAITAYNHGLGGMRRAVRVSGSKQLAHIIDRYQADSFGFASENFYAEFLAAMRTFERYEGNSLASDAPLQPAARL